MKKFIILRTEYGDDYIAYNSPENNECIEVKSFTEIDYVVSAINELTEIGVIQKEEFEIYKTSDALAELFRLKNS